MSRERVEGEVIRSEGLGAINYWALVIDSVALLRPQANGDALNLTSLLIPIRNFISELEI